MSNLKNFLVVTTSTLDGIKIKKYIKPLSAHVVAGTNVFSDFTASFSDFFGGRSQTYQKQVSAIYNEAIENLKYAGMQIGANCIIGLSVDVDEISGKGKSMFMITATGTAVVIEDNLQKNTSDTENNFDIISLDNIKILQKKKRMLQQAEENTLSVDDDFWEFATVNKVKELLPYILKRYVRLLNVSQTNSDEISVIDKQFAQYINSFDENDKVNLLYTSIVNESDEKLLAKLLSMIYNMKLLDLDRVSELLYSSDFVTQKNALSVLAYDKPYYQKDDIAKLLEYKEYIASSFKERGNRTTVKAMLSKEKEAWECECGKKNIGFGNADEYCEGCQKNIFGFKKKQVTPQFAIQSINEKVDLITELLK